MPRTHEHIPQSRRPLGVQDGRFRSGQWVMVSNVLEGDTVDRIGIYVRSSGVGAAEVHLVNSLGETTIVLPQHPVANLRTAFLEDIPAPRRPVSHPRYRSRQQQGA